VINIVISLSAQTADPIIDSFIDSFTVMIRKIDA